MYPVPALSFRNPQLNIFGTIIHFLLIDSIDKFRIISSRLSIFLFFIVNLTSKESGGKEYDSPCVINTRSIKKINFICVRLVILLRNTSCYWILVLLISLSLKIFICIFMPPILVFPTVVIEFLLLIKSPVAASNSIMPSPDPAICISLP